MVLNDDFFWLVQATTPIYSESPPYYSEWEGDLLKQEKLSYSSLETLI